MRKRRSTKLINTLTLNAAIIISLMYLVFFGIDRVNTAMEFINNDITKWLLVILAVITIYNSVARMCLDRRLDRKRKTKEQK
ncbi:MAG: hypothetical protein IKY06_08750 [Clostridia bacterium]|nr:hypothetical protein [Clostridia bacterium]MBR5985232.1 hypothetical protein [Clostridia bacterium]MBR6008884.1 hypothetical protein [Clostridia bacterium]